MNHSLPETLPCISHETRSRWLLQRIATLRDNPDFGLAAAEYAQGAVRIFEGHYMANKVMANVARRVICMSILALHFNAGAKHHGALISSLQQITSAMGLCSKNTTAATIDFLENVGLVTRIPDESDRRNHLIQPTDRLIAGASKIVGVTFAAADKLFPKNHYLQLMDGADFMKKYFASSIHSLMNVGALMYNLRGTQLFSVSDGGRILLCKLMSIKSSQQSGDRHIVSFPFDDIGHLYGFSRTHIRRLMKRAEADGLVRLLEDGGRKVRLLPLLDDIFANMVAAGLARAEFDIHLANREYNLLPIPASAWNAHPV